MDIVCCFKWVVDEAYIRAGSGKKLDFDSVDYKLSDYDRNALEEAVRLKDEQGGTVTAITVGLPDDTKGVKAALSRGAEQAYFINDDSFADLEPHQTASILAEVIASRLKYDLIICGEGSSDLYARQVGPRLAEMLDVPCISFVSRLEIKDNELVAERRTDEGVEVVAAPLPALVTVLPDINTPRIPGLKDTLAASKKPIYEITMDELQGNYEPCLQTLDLLGSNMERNCIKFAGDAAGISQFVEALRKEGLGV
jgi:electron transfer flavoprotein beta subunit